jgi:hypothetical protein
MLLNVCEGFDEGILRATAGGTVAPTVQAAAARTGPYGIRAQTSAASQTSTYTVALPSSLTTGFCYFAFNISQLANQSFLQLQDSAATAHLTFRLLSTGLVEVRRGTSSGTILTTSTYVYPISTWADFALKWTIADAGGVCQVRFNGAPVADIAFTGDTRNGGVASVRYIVLGVLDTAINSSGLPYYFDDFVVQDTTGSAPENDWLAAPEVLYAYPIASGSASGFTIGGTSPAATRWESLIQVPPDENSTLVTSSVSGDQLLMEYDDPASGGDIYAVLPGFRAKSTRGSLDLRPVHVSAGTVVSGTSTQMNPTYASYFPDVYHRAPSGALWTDLVLSGTQFGFEIST